MRVFTPALFAMAVLAMVPVSACAAELIVVTREGCPWCAKWRSEIAPVYPRTEEARIAPMREVDITHGWPEALSSVKPERFTPSFILLEDGVEIGRVRGYSGDEFFWYLLGELLAQLPEGMTQQD